jgi:hypothetical protein
MTQNVVVAKHTLAELYCEGHIPICHRGHLARADLALSLVCVQSAIATESILARPNFSRRPVRVANVRWIT